MDKGQRIVGQWTEDKGQGPLSDVLCPSSSATGGVLIPFAVHTAKFGYDWSSVPEGMSREELDVCYRAAVVRKPEYLEPGQVVSGVAAANGRTFAYSIQVAEAWDANGRNAEYSAFAFAPAILANRLDLRGLLERDEFRTPSRTPPTSVPCEFVPMPTAAVRRPPATASAAPAAAPAAYAQEGERTSVLNVVLWLAAIVFVVIAIVKGLCG